jgi:DNA-binding MurR/RpiR family transcriptional regulator
MTTAAAPDAMLMRFQPTDTATKVSRATLTRLAKQLGYKRESEVLHYAVRKLADEVLPTYEPDDGPLTAKQMAAIKKAVPQGKLKSVRSSLFD